MVKKKQIHDDSFDNIEKTVEDLKQKLRQLEEKKEDNIDLQKDNVDEQILVYIKNHVQPYQHKKLNDDWRNKSLKDKILLILNSEEVQDKWHFVKNVTQSICLHIYKKWNEKK